MNRHDELEADLAQYYHIDLERMGDDFSHSHAACLAAQLPKGARCRVADNPKHEWSDEAWLLWRIERNTSLLRWGFVNYEGEPQPKPVPYPGRDADETALAARFEMNRQLVDKAFGKNGDVDEH